MLLELFRIRRQQADGTVISRHVPGVAALAMLQNRDMRHRAQPRELAEFGRHVGHEQCRFRFREPLRDCWRRPALSMASRAARNARYRAWAGRPWPAPRCPVGSNSDGMSLHHDPFVERGEDVVARAEQSHAARFDQRIGNRGRAFGVAPPLMVNEISDRAVLAHAGTLPRLTIHGRAAPGDARVSASSVPEAWLRRAR